MICSESRQGLAFVELRLLEMFKSHSVIRYLRLVAALVLGAVGCGNLDSVPCKETHSCTPEADADSFAGAGGISDSEDDAAAGQGGYNRLAAAGEAGAEATCR